MFNIAIKLSVDVAHAPMPMGPPFVLNSPVELDAAKLPLEAAEALEAFIVRFLRFQETSAAVVWVKNSKRYIELVYTRLAQQIRELVYLNLGSPRIAQAARLHKLGRKGRPQGVACFPS